MFCSLRYINRPQDSPSQGLQSAVTKYAQLTFNHEVLCLSLNHIYLFFDRSSGNVPDVFKPNNSWKVVSSIVSNKLTHFGVEGQDYLSEAYIEF